MSASVMRAIPETHVRPLPISSIDKEPWAQHGLPVDPDMVGTFFLESGGTVKHTGFPTACG